LIASLRRSRSAVVTLLIVSSIAAIVFLIFAYLRNAHRGLPYHDSFTGGHAGEWTAYDGAWQLVQGGVQNDSSELGAKLVTGSPLWKDYTLDADVEPLGEGDAGVIVRAGDVEEGVDSYSGYYAGVRTLDQSVVLGRADHGWIEFPGRPMPGGILPYQWYHLRVAATGCSISVTATAASTRTSVTVTHADHRCLKFGMIGLRSVASGGIWKNIVAAPADSSSPSILPAISSKGLLTPPIATAPPQAEPPEQPAQSVRSLRLLSTSSPAHVTIRGTVVLTMPDLYVQDASGGARVVPIEVNHPLKVGDGVQVSGEVYPQGLSTVIRNARIRPVWERASIPPLAVTPGQAASGAFDAMSIQVEGRLDEKSLSDGSPLTLKLSDGEQTFLAVTDSIGAEGLLHRLPLNSLLRVRGVCMVSPSFTHNQVPFILILRSVEDARVISGPPWWSADHIAEILAALLALCFIAYILYSRTQDWKLRMVMAERESLSHEIHDTLSQCFAGIGFQLRGVLHRLQNESSPVELDSLRDEVSVAYGFVKRSHEVARRSLGGLRPETLASTGLIPALNETAKRLIGEGSITVDTVTTGDARPVPLHVIDSLFRIGQEAIANALQHGHPRRLRISAHYATRTLRLIVEDDGAGFSIGDRSHQRSNGFGLNGMKLRTESVNGQLDIQSAPGRGTRIVVTAPIPRRFAWLARLAYHDGHD
jgi:signal transduction histidine kinase